MSKNIITTTKTTAETVATEKLLLNSNLETVNCQVDFSLIEVKDGKVSARNLYKFLELDISNIARWMKSKIKTAEEARKELV